MQSAQLTRPRIYNDDQQHYDLPPPKGAPRWAHIQQADNEVVFDDEFDSLFDAYNNDDHNHDNNDDHNHDNNDDHNHDNNDAHNHDHNDYDDNFTFWFEPAAGETSTAGMIRGALVNSNQNENGKKEGSKKEKEKAKVSKR